MSEAPLEGDSYEIVPVRRLSTTLNSSTSHEHNVRRFLQQSPLLALSSKLLSPACAHDLGNIATYFFVEKSFDLTPEYVLQWRHFWGAMA